MRTSLTALAAATVTLSFHLTLTDAFPIYTFAPSPALLPRSDNNSSSSSTDLQSCLGGIGGGEELAYSSSSDYASLAASYNPIFDYKPLVIAVPTTEADVAAIVKCVSAQGGQHKLSPRSGGHSYEAYSLGGQDGSVVVDLRHLDSIQVDEHAKTAKVGAGVRLGTLARGIWDQGRFALPHGTCPMVGVSGHALGGGFGFTTRAWGFLLDRITAMRMVDRNGTVQTVSQGENTDLWWALRGGGANNFGVVTEFTFSLLSAPTTILNYAYSYKTNDDCAKAIVALQNMTLSTNVRSGLEPEFGGELLIAGESAGDFNGNACQLSGQHISTTRQEHDALMERFHSLAGIAPAGTPQVKAFTSWIDSLTDIMGSLNVTNPSTDHEQFYAKSLVQPAVATYSHTSALALVQKLDGYAGLQGTGNSISFDFLGPLAYTWANITHGDASFNAHGASFVYQFYSYAFPGNDQPQAQQQVWNAFDQLVATAKNSSTDAQWGAYVNYVDARQTDWPKAYYGGALDRLKELKSQWDPQTVFYFPQSLANA